MDPIGLGLAAVFSCTAAGLDGLSRKEISSWVEEQALQVDVDSGRGVDQLGALIGDARVVGLTEALHLAREPLEFRNRVFEHLVKERGFTAIAIESGIVESRVAHDYVLGYRSDVAQVMANGFSWGFGHLPQNEALLKWMRGYNETAGRGRKIRFYGFDVPGSPGSSRASRGMDTALREAILYLERVDEAAAAGFTHRLKPYKGRLRIDLAGKVSAAGYDALKSSERDALTAIVADLITLLERREAEYVARSTPADHEWAYRAAVGARQVDSWLRQTPLRPADDTKPIDLAFLSIATDVRDRAQADNVDWILTREGVQGRVLVFAHRYHLSASPVEARWWPAVSSEPRRQVMGTYLRRKLAHSFVVIGNLIGGGAAGCGGAPESLAKPPAGSIEALLQEAGASGLLLDLRRAPPWVASSFRQPQRIGTQRDALTLVPGEAFDILFYLEKVSPACPTTRQAH